MDTQTFVQTYHEPRNGANSFFRHPMARKFIYSDGVAEVAETGLYWLIDLLAFEFSHKLLKSDQVLVIFKLKVKNGQATLIGTGALDRKLFSRKIEFTDCPDGEWSFFVGIEEGQCRMILPTEY